MKKLGLTILKLLVFFLGWAVLASVLPLPSPEDAAIWRLWAEIVPLAAIVVWTALFWIVEKRTVPLRLYQRPLRGIAIGCIAGAVWLGGTLVLMLLTGTASFDGVNSVPRFAVWVLAAFLNVIMQEMLVRGYLYQMLKQNYNLAAAAVVSTALFTALHGGAFEAGLVPVLNVLTMSLLMTAVLEYTGSLVAPVVMHFFWNGVGCLLLGGVSLADDYPHLLNMTFSGSTLLSGGVYKMEGSVLVLGLNVLLTALFVVLWRRKPAETK